MLVGERKVIIGIQLFNYELYVYRIRKVFTGGSDLFAGGM